MKKIRIKPAGAAFIAVLFVLSGRNLPSYAVPIVLHELGHIAAALISGHKIAAVTLDGSGLVIDLKGAADYKTELAVSSAGPFASFVAGALLLPHFRMPAAISLVLGAVNLIPVSGLDGSGILSCAILSKHPLCVWEKLSRTLNTVFLCMLVPLSVAALIITRCNVSVMFFTAALFFDVCFKRKY